jgi:hypothetical protein
MASGEAWQSGWNLGSQLAQQRSARKQEISDEAFQTQFGELQQNIGNLQTKLSTVPPGTPEYLKTQYALQQAIESRNGLFAQKPGALQKFGHLLHLTKGPQQPAATTPLIGQQTVEVGGERVPTGPAYMVQGPQTPAQLKARAEAQRMAAGAPAYVAPQTAWEKYVANYQEVMGREAQPPKEVKEEFARTGKVTEPKPTAENFKTQSIILSDGTTVTAQQDTKSGDWFYLSKKRIPDELLDGAKSAPKELQPKTAWARDEKGKIYSVNLDARTHQEIAGTRNYGLVPPASLTGRITTGFYHYVDPATGQVFQVPETHTSVPVGGGRGTAAAPSAPMAGTAAPAAVPAAARSAASAPSVPKTPGEARRQMPRQVPPKAGGAVTPTATPSRAPGAAGPGRVIGWKGTKDYIDTKTAYEASVDRTKTMDDNLRNALRGDQQAMISLVANHIGMTLGAQKGARINQAVWNEAVESAPWLARAVARFDNRGLLSGVTLAPEQMRQMVGLAHEKVDVLKQHLDRLNAERGIGVRNPGAGDGTPGKKTVSLSAARRLPQNKGKADAQIRADIEAHGYLVGP